MEARDFALKGPGRLIRSPVHEGQRARSSSSSAITVKASIDRIVPEAKALREIGINPQDSFDNMKAFAARHGFTFPYVVDSTQEVARAYDAQCIPDFFGFNAKDELQYRGRLDASRTTPVRRDLFDAMKQVAETGRGPQDQVSSMGCSIKWKH